MDRARPERRADRLAAITNELQFRWNGHHHRLGSPFYELDIKVDLDGGNANSAKFKLTSIGGDTEGSNPLDHLTFQVGATDGDGDSVANSFSVHLATAPPLVADNQMKTVDEAALDTTTDPGDLGHGTVTGSNPLSTAETATGQLAIVGAASYVAESLTGSHGLFELHSDGSYVYTLTSPVTEPLADNGTDTVNGVESFSYTALDGFGGSVNGTITVNVVDDVPTAGPVIVFPPIESGQIVAGNVETNDVGGADGIASIAWTGESLGTVTGSLGVLTVGADGSYSYHANPNSAGGTDIFTYTITDGDGDTSSAPLFISVVDGQPSVLPAVGTVDEAGLITGSSPSILTTVAHGTLNLFDPDSPQVTSIAGATTSVVSGPSTTVNGTYGTLTIDPSGNYTYVLTTDDLHHTTQGTGIDGQADVFTYTVTDSFGNTNTSTITISIQDDVPTANVDAALTVVETAAATAGTNLLANDVKGADGATVTAVDFGDGNGFHLIAASGTTPLTTANGTYTFQANGTWTFDPAVNPSNSDTTGNFTYQITDGDGDTSTALQTVNITNANTIPTAGTDSFTVDEDGLPGGFDGGPGDVSGTATSHSGTLPANFMADGAAASGAYNFTTTSGTVVDSNGHNVSSGGATLSYFWDLTGHVLYGSTNISDLSHAQSTAAFTVSLNADTGAYTYTELKPLDHPGHDADGLNNGPETAYEDNLTVNIHFQVTDSNGDHAVTDGTLAVTTNDDSPVANGESQSTPEGSKPSVNLVLVIDTSGSMGDDPNVTGFATRLALAKAAAIDLINSANVNQMMVVDFASDAHHNTESGSVWTDKTDAINYINSLTSGGNTNYDAALGEVTGNWGTGPTAADQTLVYFLSDGQPNPTSSGIDATEEATWINFLNNPDSGTTTITNVFAVGIGSGLSGTDANALEPVAWTPGEVAGTNTTAASDHNVFTVTDESQLSATLTGTLTGSVTGNVLDNDHFGADGPHTVSGHFDGIMSITVDSHVYTFDGSTVSLPGGNPAGATASGGTLNVDTTLGGHLSFDFGTGSYSYSPPASVSSDQTETFHYVIADGDGDQTGADLAITVQNVNQPPTITSGATGTEAENTAISHVVYQTTATDPDSDTLTYSLTGTDAAAFTISAGGAVTFNTSPNFESPTDSGGNNVYDIVVHANDGHGHDVTQAVAITVTNVNDVAPTITSGATGTEAENTVNTNVVYQTTVTDPDGGTTTYSLTGTDAALFNVTASGGVRFNTPPNFEAPGDAGGNNVYDIVVHANDGIHDTTKAVQITVTNVNEAPVAGTDHVITEL